MYRGRELVEHVKIVKFGHELPKNYRRNYKLSLRTTCQSKSKGLRLRVE